jgi:hypothetical protein
VLSKPLWESAFFADFHQRRQFPQAAFLFARCFSFYSCSRFSLEKYGARMA